MKFERSRREKAAHRRCTSSSCADAPDQIDEGLVDKVALVVEVMVNEADRYARVFAHLADGQVLESNLADDFQCRIDQTQTHPVVLGGIVLAHLRHRFARLFSLHVHFHSVVG
jgi:hypothetical protein